MTEPAAAAKRTGTVVALEAPAPNVRILRVALEGPPLSFQAGQYARVRFDDLPARDYSLASRPGEAPIEFHIRVNGGRDVSRYVRTRLAEGDRVGIEGPFGEAYLRRDHAGPILAVAGGTGVVPIKSIVDTALAEGMTQDIHLYLGGREERDLYPEPHFLEMAARHPNLRVVPVLSEPVPGSRRRTGNVTDALAADFHDLRGFKCYVAGPPPMVEAAVGVLGARGIAAADIHADPFTQGDRHAARKGTPESGP